MPSKLRHARKSRQLPDGRVLAAIAKELDPTGRYMLVEALAYDGELPGYEDEIAEAQTRMATVIRALSPARRRALLVLLGLEDELGKYVDGEHWGLPPSEEEPQSGS